MRTLALAAMTMVTVLGGTAADAQRIGYPGAPYPAPGTYPVQPGGGVPVVQPPPPMVDTRSAPSRGYPERPRTGGSRWGGSVSGRWYGGTYAPGGWNAYRRPSRGWQMPVYWTSPSFAISDYASYGLAAPPRGYGWHRYYDDAVLLDDRGRVYDSRGGIDWDRAYAQGSGGYAYARGGAGSSGTYTTSDYGYGYSDGDAGPQPDYAPAPLPYESLPPPVQHGAVTTYQTGGYTSGSGASYGAPGTTTTVVTIQPTETVTTTTTEYVEETRYAAPRRVYHAPKRHYRVVRRSCGCGCCR